MTDLLIPVVQSTQIPEQDGMGLGNRLDIEVGQMLLDHRNAGHDDDVHERSSLFTARIRSTTSRTAPAPPGTLVI